MAGDALKSAYEGLLNAWRGIDADQRALLLDQFKVSCSFNSGNIENPEITYHDTAEIFDESGVSNFTGDVRTIYEINNLKNAWTWLEDALAGDATFDEELVLSAHLVLTRGTYEDGRWAKGDYRVTDDVGAAPDEIPELVGALVAEVRDALLSEGGERNALTIAAYLHAQLVDIHPFADGNGRTARLLMNYVLLRLGSAPCTISADDRLAYFGALDAFHQEGELAPFVDFCRIQTLKTWECLL